jgi:hypothetical protein
MLGRLCNKRMQPPAYGSNHAAAVQPGGFQEPSCRLEPERLPLKGPPAACACPHVCPLQTVERLGGSVVGEGDAAGFTHFVTLQAQRSNPLRGFVKSFNTLSALAAGAALALFLSLLIALPPSLCAAPAGLCCLRCCAASQQAATGGSWGAPP